MDHNLGEIRFVREVDKSISISQHWNPQLILPRERRKIAQTLREIADEMDQNMFENMGVAKFFAAPKKSQGASK